MMIIYEDGEQFNVPQKWLADHDKQIRDEAIENFAEWLVDKGILGNRCIADGEITNYGKVYVKEFKKQSERGTEWII